ncbi:uncharacterized protein LOC110726645 [Chenopodium quinoa]|uniref:uncharacterized protein LOC110726645 n=1 Tax=Chenopodium quinoa TaxID=63459 RepID=UPI000B79433E|nr:uncharacterized protein LOC110726645 [Chenopodium quinoa]
MADEIVSRYANLHLDEEEGGVVDLGVVESEQLTEKFNLMLIGRLVTNRPYNVEAFKSTMIKVWTLSNKLIIRTLSPNLYVFQFFHWRDKEKVLTGRPWCFDNMLLVLKEIEGGEQPEQVSLFHSPFWVRLRNLPFNCRSDNDVRELVINLGDLMEIEKDVLGLDRFRRVRVMINVPKPLRRYQKIRDKGGKEAIVEFTYERLPFFCYACGVIGHSERDCAMISEEAKKKQLEWGRWLKASPRKGRMKELEEVEAVLSTRKQFFITRHNKVEDDEIANKEVQELDVLEGNGYFEQPGSMSRKNKEVYGEVTSDVHSKPSWK